jgi:hypothetical protein
MWDRTDAACVFDPGWREVVTTDGVCVTTEEAEAMGLSGAYGVGMWLGIREALATGLSGAKGIVGAYEAFKGIEGIVPNDVLPYTVYGL